MYENNNKTTISVEATARFGANNLITLVIMSYRSDLRIKSRI